MTILISDIKLFAIVLYSAFVNNEHLTIIRDIWNFPWVTGTTAASAIGLVGWLISPIILAAIINGLGFGVEGIAAGSFGAWFMSLYGGMVQRGSLLSILQSIGAAGLGSLGTSISSGFGAAIGILIGAIGGSELATYFSKLELNEPEEQILGSLVQIEGGIYQNNHMIILTLLPALLYNDTMLKCFIETFITCSPFAESKLFRFDFKENNLSKLKSEERKVNHTIYNLLIGDYKKSELEYIFRDDNLTGYYLNLSNYQSSNKMINLLVEIWKIINGNVNINIDNIRDQIQDRYHKFSDYFKKLGENYFYKLL
ncbi:hypothetical protein C1645_807443 [Glomus cerebriforme]|uniref:Uncharacterized protein n=1 Tax=Glomus cerebriforme TaxID=658196 RepID=A0A397SN99_9GLOM|nr:hypothetical protein C1645_807443 [Glomus cerebriforme]